MQAQQTQAKINQEVAVALERLNGRMESWETWRKEVDEERREDNRRLTDRVEQAPAVQRSIIETYGGCIGQAVFALFSLCGLCISVASFIIVLTH